MSLEQRIGTAVDALEEIKARDIVVLDVSRMTSLFDRLVIASADSARQTKALANNVQERLKAAGADIIGVEGEQGAEWILVDTGDLVVHIMQPATRQYYALEDLWGYPETAVSSPPPKRTVARPARPREQRPAAGDA